MYRGKSVSLVLPAFNEEENIGKAVREFRKIKLFDEIIVVNNNSDDRTEIRARKAGARIVLEKKQGYGFALRKGMFVSKGDLVFLSEPDGTFEPDDAFRLLEKIESFDLVCGSRTNRKFIKPKANMKLFLRSGNYILAKLIQLLFLTESLSDCGCTFRVFRKKVIKKIAPKLTVGGSYILPETVVLAKLYGFKLFEVPVSYKKRVGNSKITGSKVRAVVVGWNMFRTIIRYRFFAKSYIH